MSRRVLQPPVSRPLARSSGPRAGAVAVAIAAGLVCLTIAAYAPVRHHDFINLDDVQYVSGNPAVLAGLTWEGVTWAFTSGHAGNWHPLTWLSHMLDVELFGPGPGPQHITNLVLHIASTLLLFGLLTSLTGARLRGAIVAALFAVHPLHVESVAWIAERKDVLCLALSLAALQAYVAYVRAPRWSRAALVCVLMAAALMAKPMAVTLPFVMLLLDVWPLGRFGRSAVREKLPLFALAAASSVVTVLVQQQSGAVQSVVAFPLMRRVGTALMAYVVYIGKAVWPAALAPLYPYPDLSWIAVVGAALVLAALTALALRAASRWPYAAVGWFWYLGTLVPVIGLIQVGSQPYADRYTYLPLIGMSVAVVWGLADALGRSWAGRTALAVVASLAVVGCALLTRAQVAHWRDAVTLWRHTVAVTEGNYRAHTNLGQALTAAGRSAEALPAFETAIRLRPDFAEARNYHGVALMDRGDVERAAVEFGHAVRLLPRFVEARNNLGLALAQMGRLPEAVTEFKEAIRLSPAFAPAHTNLGIALAQLGRLDEAAVAFREAARLQPDSVETHLNLAAALTDLGRVAEAIGQYDLALRLDPASAAAQHGWGRALVRDNRPAEGLRRYEAALRLDVSLASAPGFRFDLAVAFARTGAREDAIRELETVLRLDPSHEGARELLAQIRRD